MPAPVDLDERAVALALAAVEGAVSVGEERVAAHADEQPDRAGHDALGADVVEGDRGVLDEHVAARLSLAGLGPHAHVQGDASHP